MKNNGKENFNRILKWLVRLILLITLGIFAWKQQWYEVKILAITFIITFYEWGIEKAFKIQLPIWIQIAITSFIFAAQYLGTVMGWYDAFYYWDIILHTISGGLFFAIGIFLFRTIQEKSKQDTTSAVSLLLLFGICFSLSIGVIWEIIEFSADTFVGSNMQRAIGEVGRQALMDTMTDLIVATIGTVVTAIGYGIWSKRKTIGKK